MTYKGNGRECHCAAYSENECACGADWTPDEVYELRARVSELEAEKDMWQGKFYVVEAENIALHAKEKQRLAVKQRLVRADKRS